MLAKLLIPAVFISLSGCGLFQQTAKPSEITLAKAMQEVGTGLKAMKMAEGDVKTGLIASEVTVVFNIAASDKKSGNLTIDLSAPTVAGAGTGKLGGGLTSETGSQRGNTVTVKFVNLLMIPKDTLAYKGTLADLNPVVSGPNPLITPYKLKLDTKNFSPVELQSLQLQNEPK
jgi:hypothetical protein